jgi:hypothetical protein
MQEQKFLKAKVEGKAFEAANIDYEHLVGLIPEEYGSNTDLDFK